MKTIAALVVIQHLELGAAFIDKHKPVTTMRLHPQLALNQRRQPIKLFAHIGIAGIQPDTPIG